MPKSNSISFILRAKRRLEVLQLLKDGKKISAQLENETGMYKSHMSRTLRELQNKKLIKCINPKDRNFKFYELTSNGKKVLIKANKILKEIS